MFKSRAPILLAEKASREGRRITHEEIAKATGLRRPTISVWLSYRPMSRMDASVAKALCDYFGVTINELVTFEDEASGQLVELAAV